MNDGKVDWHGNFVAVATPFTATGEIDEAKFRANIELLLSEGAHGIVVSGCTGESWALEPEERLQLFRIAVETAGSAPVIAGTGGIITAKVIAWSRAAIEAGAAGVLVLPPYYAVIKPREIKAHFKAISDELCAPIILYNMPKRTGINMSPAFIAELAELDWIVALKQRSHDLVELEATLATCGDRILVFAGHSAERGFPAVLLGCPGFVSSMESQIMGREAIALYQLASSRDMEAGRRTQERTLELDRGMRAIGTFPANMKAAMNLLGRPGGHSRQPLLDLDEGELEQVRRVLADMGLFNDTRDVA